MFFLKKATQDWQNNKGNTKGRLVLLLFRLCALAYSNRFTKILFILYIAFYKFFVEWVLGIDIPGQTNIGKGFQLYHGQATIIHKNAVIGSNCVVRQCVTIGEAYQNGGCPVLGNNVNVGCNVCIIGPVNIGDNVIIGAGSIVVKDVPPNCVIAGNPARIIRSFEPVKV